MAQRIPANALQSAIYTLLTGDATITSLGASVLDYVPSDQDYPYIVIGSFSLEGQQAKSVVSVVTIEIECMSSVGGMDEVNQMMDAIVEALTTSAPTLSGFSTHVGVLDSAEADVAIDPQGQIIRVGTVRIRWWVKAS